MTRLALALAVLLVAGAAPAAAAELPPSQRHVMGLGHADVINVRSDAGTLLANVKDDAGEDVVYRDPGEVLLHAKPESQLTVPDLPEYAFLGDPGDLVWILPEVEDPNLLWPGWETKGVAAADFPDATLTWRLLDLRGPGEVSVFATDPLGTPIKFLDSAAGLPQDTQITNRTHAHANWAFEAEGLYVMTVEVIGRRADGATVSTGPIDYHWFVGDLAHLPADVPATTLTVDGLQPSYVAGAPVMLSAVQTPDSGQTDVRWAVRCPDAGSWSPAGRGAQLQFAAALDQDGCAYRAALRTVHGTLHATSAPVTLRVRPAEPAPPGTDSPPSGGAGDPPAPAVARPLQARVSAARASRTLTRVRRAGAIRLRCGLDGAGTCRIRASIDAQTARRLGLGRKRVTIGRGSASITRADVATVRVQLTRRGRLALRRAGRRLHVRLAVTATGADRPPGTTRASITLTP
jgi:surface-anchored protein